MRLRRVGILIAIILGALTLSYSDPVHASCSPNYTVRRGDSWWSIAENANVSLKQVLRLNGAKTSTTIKPKDAICIPEPPPEVKTYSQAEVIAIIREVWPDDLEDRAIFIARRESKLNPSVIGIPNDCCYGLFQIYYKWHKSWLPRVGVTFARQLLDPRLNTLAALEIYRRNNGWGPWE